MKKLHSLTCLLLILLTALGCEDENPEPSELDESYAVYNVLIDSLIEDVAVISAESYSGQARFCITDNQINSILEFYPEFPAGLVQELPVVDEDSLIYENRFQGQNKEIVVLNSAELLELLPPGIGYQESWQTFLEAYGETAQRMALTRISFNEEHTQAVFGAAVGRWSYSGYMVYCEKVNGTWVIQSIVNTWIT